MNRRRAFLSMVATSGIVVWPGVAIAQAFKAPDPEDLFKLIENPNLVERSIAATSSLRELLLLELSRKQAINVERWRTDSEKFIALLNQLRDESARKSVLMRLKKPDERAALNAITEKAIPAARQMEDVLKNGGLQPGSPISTDLLRSFLQVNLFLVARSSGNDSWYCRIYPLSIVC